jgi:hypothetical protein
MSIPSAADINKLGFRVPYDPASGDKPQLQANGASKGGLREDFMWGFATASAQIEGGGKEKEEASGRGRSVSLTPASLGVLADISDLGYALR